MNYAVLMAGGSGTRLWPMSRKAKPKQLHSLISEKSLIQETFDRVKKAVPVDQIMVSTIAKYKDEIKKQLPDIPEENFIVEPVGRNTAPSILYVTKKILKEDPEAIIVTLASDHVVDNIDEFVRMIEASYKAAQKHPDHLIAVGIKPTRSDTGLGYIKIGKAIEEIDGEAVFKVDKFVEKPDLATAEKYVKGWEYFWNGAYYFFRAEELVNWFVKYRPQLNKKMDEMINFESKPNGGTRRAKELYESFEDEQFEYAIIEQKDFKKVLVIPADLGWSDVGNWGTLLEILSTKFGSKIISRGHHVDVGSENCLVYGDSKLIATVGLSNIIVVDTPDAILIADQAKAQSVKALLDKFKEEGKHLYL
ncbi:hypothetical protein COT77_01425 [Candidatus Berkelbacteria bacterium CG10_big_fil_rev_8_21_14_0_10_41_12]|uniref:Mannose-1-phosphate guanylyltransferase n=1 Tax=Candidatus Berkelbacteria bacterium CG10_big_fil_rev_8_21_14_0_10_41_12 TaxID=1974513 RepID=A0A2M6WXD9_9BACT|nr:MAG: hypothetical protein COT77_01425 [Candidatus Berkelbacteria bacterium CG10_big_fil_rev_8_21_14_0_10_41_12]